MMSDRARPCRRFYTPEMATLFRQPPAGGIGNEAGVPFVAVVDGVHVFDRIEVAHDVGRAERLAGLYRFAVDLFDHDDDVPRPLTAPGFVDDRRVERESRQPGALFAGRLIAQVVGAD